MRHIWRRGSFALILLFSALSVFAQSVPAQDAGTQTADIELPDVTTRIEGTDISALADALPLPPAAHVGAERAALPLPDTLTIPAEAFASKKEEADNSRKGKPMYIEGAVGGGYPGIFIGDFTVYQPATLPAFRLNFSHKSIFGYGNHIASNGFTDTETAISGLADFGFSDKLNLELNAGYDTYTSGMQNKSLLYYNTTVQDIIFNAGIDWLLPAGFKLSGTLGSIFDNQFMGFARTLSGSAYTGMSFVSVDPGILLDWKADKLAAYFSGAYSLGLLAQPVYGIDHRGELSAGITYTLTRVTLGASAGAVIRSENGSLFPFSLSASVLLPAGFSLSASGGLNSRGAIAPDILKKQPFMPFTSLPGEESDWNASFSAENTLVPGLTISAGLDFAQTAFGNGQVVSSYEAYGTAADPVTGLFAPVRWNRTVFDTTLGAQYRTGIVSFAALWTAHWLDYSRLNSAHEVYLKAGLLAEDSRWGADFYFNMGSDIDYLPEISISGFYGITDNLRVSAELTDIVMFFVSEQRIKAAPYIQHGAAGLLKLQLLF